MVGVRDRQGDKGGRGQREGWGAGRGQDAWLARIWRGTVSRNLTDLLHLLPHKTRPPRPDRRGALRGPQLDSAYGAPGTLRGTRRGRGVAAGRGSVE